MTCESVQRNISPTLGASPPPDHDRRGPASPPACLQHRQRQDTALPSSQTAIFRASAPLLVFAVLVAGLLVELRTHLAPPLSPPHIFGTTVTVHGNTVAEHAMIWAEAHWPGIWVLPVLCAGALAALRVAIYAGAVMVDALEERGLPGAAGGVRVGRWEDGGSVSGRDLLAGVLT